METSQNHYVKPSKIDAEGCIIMILFTKQIYTQNHITTSILQEHMYVSAQNILDGHKKLKKLLLFGSTAESWD